MQQPKNMQIVSTEDGPFLVSQKIQFNDRNSSDIGSTVLGRGYLPPFPVESVAHMLPFLWGLLETYKAHINFYASQLAEN